MGVPSSSARLISSGLSATIARWQHSSRNVSNALSKFWSFPRTTGVLKAYVKEFAMGMSSKWTPNSFLTMMTPMMSSRSFGALGSLLYTKSRECPHARMFLMHASSMIASCASIFASLSGEAMTSAVLWCSSRTPWIMFISSKSRLWLSCFMVRTSAFKSSLLCSSTWWPSDLSRSKLKGQAMGSTTAFTNRTTGEKAAAKTSWLFPVKTAEGMISPKMRTTLTERTMASQLGTNVSRKRGNASLATALQSSSVTKR
mmetsp:Transcript_93374/g.247882  ORF Transcript_93374/g.247882 Transcript_93374/m.247882 type:complete len:257 (+) Transcript_93374:416-1186(+)